MRDFIACPTELAPITALPHGVLDADPFSRLGDRVPVVGPLHPWVDLLGRLTHRIVKGTDVVGEVRTNPHNAI